MWCLTFEPVQMINVYVDYIECRNEADRWCKSVYSWPRWGEPPDHNAAVNEIIYLSLLQQSQHVCVNVYGRCDGDDVEVPTTAIHPSISWHTRTHTRTSHMATSYPLHASTVIWPGASSRPWSTYGATYSHPRGMREMKEREVEWWRRDGVDEWM